MSGEIAIVVCAVIAFGVWLVIGAIASIAMGDTTWKK